PCTTPGTVCGGNGSCIGGPNSIFAVYGEGDTFCAAGCPQSGFQSTCRTNYACYGGTTGMPGFCWLDPIPPFDGGGAPDKLGNACANDTACQNPPAADWGFCLPEVDSMGATGFTGGYCVAECTYDNTGNFCGNNG